jgi:hypothetical protein
MFTVLEATADKRFKTFVEYPLKLKFQEGLIIDCRFVFYELGYEKYTNYLLGKKRTLPIITFPSSKIPLKSGLVAI